MVSCLLIAAAAEMLLWIRVIVSMLAMEATPLPSSESCVCKEGIKILIYSFDAKTNQLALSLQKD